MFHASPRACGRRSCTGPQVDKPEAPTQLPKCPLHPQYDINVKKIRTKRGMSDLYHCPHEECVVACFDNLEEFLDTISRTMYYSYRDPHHPMVCYCHELLSLRTSHSEKNPGRLYFTCRGGNCNIFQWADEEPRSWIQEHWDWYNSK